MENDYTYKCSLHLQLYISRKNELFELEIESVKVLSIRLLYPTLYADLHWPLTAVRSMLLSLCSPCPQMISTRFNPFTWDKTADQIDSNVVGLELKSSGEALYISNLKKDILISIPRRPGENSSLGNDSYFLKPNKMRYHRVNIVEPGSVLNIKVSGRRSHSLWHQI